MATLTLRGQAVESIFDLLGRDENGMTAALGLAFIESPAVLNGFIELVAPGTTASEPIEVRLQEFDRVDRGFTDIEIRSPEHHVIIEAKRGWEPPDEVQLNRYQDRLVATGRSNRRLVILTQTGAEPVVLYRLGSWRPTAPTELKVVGWSNVVGIAEVAGGVTAGRERRHADDFAAYVRGVAEMQDRRSNRVFVVSLAHEAWPGFSMTPIELVEERNVYFFPTTGGPWPRNPPNYIAFRYDGKLQSIRHVDIADVIAPGGELAPGIQDIWGEPHFVLRLGPPISPPHEIRTGPEIKRNRLVWADIDLLLTSSTISVAEILSRARHD